MASSGSAVRVGASSYGAAVPAHLDDQRSLRQALGRVCRDGLPVVITSRCPIGRVSPVYGGAGGGGRDLEDAGAIFAGDLKGPKARLLLIAALGDTAARDRVREVFNSVAP